MRQPAEKSAGDGLAGRCNDYVLFTANTGVRPNEAARLQYRDVGILKDEGTRQTILDIEVRGKRGVGNRKSTTGAVRPFELLKYRNVARPTDRIFPMNHHKLFNTIWNEEGLKN